MSKLDVSLRVRVNEGKREEAWGEITEESKESRNNREALEISKIYLAKAKKQTPPPWGLSALTQKIVLLTASVVVRERTRYRKIQGGFVKKESEAEIYRNTRQGQSQTLLKDSGSN